MYIERFLEMVFTCYPVISVFLVLAAIVMLVGTVLFGFILGNIVSSLQSAEANRLKYEEKLSAVSVIVFPPVFYKLSLTLGIWYLYDMILLYWFILRQT